jgi:ribose transport system permease protein
MSESDRSNSGVVAKRGSGGAGRVAKIIMLRYTVLVVLAVMIVAAVLLYPGFLSWPNVRNILSQNAPVGIIAVGMTFVIIGGGFDISVGSIFALAATVFAGVAIGHSLAGAAVVALSVGLAAGIVNGLLVTLLRVNAFVATLATTSIFLGLARLYSHNQPFMVDKESFSWLGTGQIGPIKVSIVILIVVFVCGEFVLKKSVFGRSLYSVGGNEEASRLSGIRVRLVRASTYAITGVLSALGGMTLASKLMLGQADFGPTIALDAIAVVVIGGASLMGGVGSMWKTAAGLFILAILTNLFNSLSVDTDVQLIIKGAIIAAAVAFDMFARTKGASLDVGHGA